MKYLPFRILNTGVLVATLTLIPTLWEPDDAQEADRPPNILYIVADDLGWKDVGFHGSDIRTPTLDALAAKGAKLEQFYAQPMCTPTRAAAMTGRYPMRYGLQTAVIPQGPTYGLATDEWLLPQALKEAGYETAIVGKWHLGHADQKFWPRQRGFDHAYGPLIGEIDYFSHKVDGKVDWFRDNEVVEEEGYSTTLFGNEAVKLIEGHDLATPLFLYLAFNAVHAPYQAPQEYLDRYKDIEDPSRRAYAASATGWTIRSGVSLPPSTRRRCSTTRSSSSRATTAEREIPCSLVQSPTCLRSCFQRTTGPIAMAKARFTKAEHASSP